MFILGIIIFIISINNGCTNNSDLKISTYEESKKENSTHPPMPHTSNTFSQQSQEPNENDSSKKDNSEIVPDFSSSNYKWDIPKNWKEVKQKKSFIRLAGFKIVYPKNSKNSKLNQEFIDASIVILGPQAGNISANVNRWRAQLNLETLPDKIILNTTQKIKSKTNKDILMYQIENNKTNKAMLAAVYKLKDSNIFFKLIGSVDLIKKEKSNFIKLCRSFIINK